MSSNPKKYNSGPIVLHRESPVDRFFKIYSNFQHNSLQPSAEEYKRLTKAYAWKRGDPRSETAWAGFRDALVKEFNKQFGTDASDLLAWQNLCQLVGIDKIYESCDDCHKALKKEHFNLVDLIDVRRRGTEIVQVFPTKEALEEYTRRTASYFPFGNPRAGKLLRKLLSKPGLQVSNSQRAMQDTHAKDKAKAKNHRHPTSLNPKKNTKVEPPVGDTHAKGKAKSKKYTRVGPPVGDRAVIALAKFKDIRRPSVQRSKRQIVLKPITEREGPIKAKAEVVDDRRPTTRNSKKNMIAEIIRESNTYPSSTRQPGLDGGN